MEQNRLIAILKIQIKPNLKYISVFLPKKSQFDICMSHFQLQYNYRKLQGFFFVNQSGTFFSVLGLWARFIFLASLIIFAGISVVSSWAREQPDVLRSQTILANTSVWSAARLDSWSERARTGDLQHTHREYYAGSAAKCKPQ